MMQQKTDSTGLRNYLYDVILENNSLFGYHYDNEHIEEKP